MSCIEILLQVSSLFKETTISVNWTPSEDDLSKATFVVGHIKALHHIFALEKIIERSSRITAFLGKDTFRRFLLWLQVNEPAGYEICSKDTASSLHRLLHHILMFSTYKSTADTKTKIMSLQIQCLGLGGLCAYAEIFLYAVRDCFTANAEDREYSPADRANTWITHYFDHYNAKRQWLILFQKLWENRGEDSSIVKVGVYDSLLKEVQWMVLDFKAINSEFELKNAIEERFTALCFELNLKFMQTFTSCDCNTGKFALTYFNKDSFTLAVNRVFNGSSGVANAKKLIMKISYADGQEIQLLSVSWETVSTQIQYASDEVSTIKMLPCNHKRVINQFLDQAERGLEPNVVRQNFNQKTSFTLLYYEKEALNFITTIGISDDDKQQDALKMINKSHPSFLSMINEIGGVKAAEYFQDFLSALDIHSRGFKLLDLVLEFNGSLVHMIHEIGGVKAADVIKPYISRDDAIGEVKTLLQNIYALNDIMVSMIYSNYEVATLKDSYLNAGISHDSAIKILSGHAGSAPARATVVASMDSYVKAGIPQDRAIKILSGHAGSAPAQATVVTSMDSYVKAGIPQDRAIKILSSAAGSAPAQASVTKTHKDLIVNQNLSEERAIYLLSGSGGSGTAQNLICSTMNKLKELKFNKTQVEIFTKYPMSGAAQEMLVASASRLLNYFNHLDVSIILKGRINFTAGNISIITDKCIQMIEEKMEKKSILNYVRPSNVTKVVKAWKAQNLVI